MEEDEAMAAYALLLCSLKKNEDTKKSKLLRQKRKYKVRPINRERQKYGFYRRYFVRMKQIDHQQFFKYTRMEVQTFNELLQLVTPLIQKKDMNNLVVPEERLAMTLHYLSQGSSMQTVAWKYHVGKATVHCVIKETCKALCQRLEPMCLVTPHSQQEWLNIAEDFWHKWHFPHCIGALDGKHVQIRAPKKSGSLYYNYQKHFSIVLLAVCDANYKFTVVDIGGYGSVSDGGTLQESVFGEQLKKQNLRIPEAETIAGSNTNMKFPYFFVADAPFPLNEHIMRPYPGGLLGDRKEYFNKRLSRARRLIENTFGVMAARWRILYQPINADVSLVELITRTCVCLHNFLCKPASHYCPPGYVDSNDDENGQWRQELSQPLQSITLRRTNAKHSAYSVRDHLAQFLHSGR